MTFCCDAIASFCRPTDDVDSWGGSMSGELADCGLTDAVCGSDEDGDKTWWKSRFDASVGRLDDFKSNHGLTCCEEKVDTKDKSYML